MGVIVLIDDDESERRTFFALCSDRELAGSSEQLSLRTPRQLITLLRKGSLKSENIDCVFVDLQLDPVDETDRGGLEASEVLRDALGSVPIVAYTRHTEMQELSEVTAREFDGILIKQEFMDTVRFTKERFERLVLGWRKKRGLGGRVNMVAGPPTPTMVPPSILHLSDLQFGRAHAKPREMAESIVSAISDEKMPNIVFVSGDLSQHGEPEEYEAAKAFLECLAEEIGIGKTERNRIVICPGNHDVSWPLSIGGYFDELAVRREQPLNERKVFRYRMGPFFEFREVFYSPSRREGGAKGLDDVFLVTTHDLREYGLLVININSSAHEDFVRKIGRLDDVTIEKLEEEAAHLSNANDSVICAVMHHPLQVGVGSGSSAGPEDVICEPTAIARRLWRSGIRMVFTGHLHASSIEKLVIEAGTREGGGGLINFLAGSAGVPETDRPYAGGVGHFANEFSVLRSVVWPNEWELEAFYLDAASRAFLPKPKFSGPSATTPVTLLKAFDETTRRRRR